MQKINELLREVNTYSHFNHECNIILNGRQIYLDEDSIVTAYEFNEYDKLVDRLEYKIECAKKCGYGLEEHHKITNVTDEAIELTNMKNPKLKLKITFDQECDSENAHNYADFEQLEEAARDYVFKGNIVFEHVPGSGFRFGDSRRLFFVPCYSDQTGYYSDDIDIYLNGNKVLNVNAEISG